MPTPFLSQLSTSFTDAHLTAAAAIGGGPDFTSALHQHPVIGGTALALATGVGLLLINGQRQGGGRTNKGFASNREMRRRLGIGVRRNEMELLRPDLDEPRKQGPTEVGISLGRCGMPLLASWEDVIGLIAPPRSGKTAFLAGAIIDAPGSVVATSTKADTYTLTYQERQDKGEVYVFNPMGLGSIPSTFRWNPIIGCHNVDTAIRRAGYLLVGSPGTTGTQDKGFWEGNNFKVLRSLLFAAAITGKSMRDVHRWISSSLNQEPLTILRKYELTPAGWDDDLAQVYGGPEKTRESIFMTLALTFEFMSNPALAQAVEANAFDKTFDFTDFHNGSKTLYLLAEDRTHGSISSLLSAITGEVFDHSKRVASQNESGRLDPPLMIGLDEAATICPVPLDRWTADGGSRGISIIYAVQAPAQLEQRWGAEGARIITNNTAGRLVFGGMTDDKGLQSLSTLCGKRIERTHTHSNNGGGKRSTSVSEKEVDVMPPAKIRTLKNDRVLLLYRNLPPILADLTPVWNRPDYKKRHAGERRTARRNELRQRQDAEDPTTLARPILRPEALERPKPSELDNVIDVRSRQVRSGNPNRDGRP